MATVNISTSATLVVPEDHRNAVLLQNLSDTDIVIGHSPAVTVEDGPHSGLRIKADGGTLALTALPGDWRLSGRAIYARHAGVGTKPLRYITY